MATTTWEDRIEVSEYLIQTWDVTSALAPLMGINYYTAMKRITLTSRGRIVHVNVVVFCRHWLFHEGFVKNDSIHFNMIVVFNQSVLCNEKSNIVKTYFCQISNYVDILSGSSDSLSKMAYRGISIPSFSRMA